MIYAAIGHPNCQFCTALFVLPMLCVWPERLTPGPQESKCLGLTFCCISLVITWPGSHPALILLSELIGLPGIDQCSVCTFCLSLGFEKNCLLITALNVLQTSESTSPIFIFHVCHLHAHLSSFYQQERYCLFFFIIFFL